jgi:site-specific recombinase XerD
VFKLWIAQRDPQLVTLRLWRWSRTTAWRHVKAVMAAVGTAGAAAMPKGLRHGFEVHAIQSKAPPHLVQRWLGMCHCAVRRSTSM